MSVKIAGNAQIYDIGCSAARKTVCEIRFFNVIFFELL